ncbi:NAD-dependent epimerase/dehydratase family protein [Smaragdicoccus niigatensis]|uniref:NAD-dependent epimerase/dehydratase family protein n=1 Tax=Smaragdicoccus niigatensis TaxID=359359 RepID=UPI00036791E1|nr:NAD-dependent epimerase/dehydratase family protein [Smaragdicoccus niigatensis]
MRVLLTGSAGFIGSAVAAELRSHGHEVVEFDAYLPSAHGDSSGVRRDVRDGYALDEALKGVDVVCHQAAVVGAGVDALDAPAFASHNDFGTAVLLAAMARAGCTRLVLASSMVVYGEGRYRGADEVTRSIADLRAGRFDPLSDAGEPLSWEVVPEDAPLRPRSFYAASKLAQEHFALAWTRTTGGSVVALRYHNVYGPNMPRDTPYSGVAAMFRSSLERGEPPRVFEDGQQMRDFVEVSDVARANRLAVESSVSGFEAVNVCSGRPVSILEVASALSSAVGGPQPVVTGEFRPGDVRHIVASPAKARDVLGFEAGVAPRDGLAGFATAPLRATTGHTRPTV